MCSPLNLFNSDPKNQWTRIAHQNIPLLNDTLVSYYHNFLHNAPFHWQSHMQWFRERVPVGVAVSIGQDTVLDFEDQGKRANFEALLNWPHIGKLTLALATHLG